MGVATVLHPTGDALELLNLSLFHYLRVRACCSAGMSIRADMQLQPPGNKPGAVDQALAISKVHARHLRVLHQA